MGSKLSEQENLQTKKVCTITRLKIKKEKYMVNKKIILSMLVIVCIEIILSVLIMGCIATVAGAGKWAYYTSSATDRGNFTSGNMKITVTQSIDDVDNIDDVDKIVPDYKFEEKPTIVVTNDGNINIEDENRIQVR